MNALLKPLQIFLVLLAPVAAAQSQWKLRYPLPTPHGLLGVTYANGLFVAVGYNNTILTSPDAVTWTSRSPEGPALLTDVAYGNGKFVAAGIPHKWASREGNDRLVLWTSFDGLTWTERPSQSGSFLIRVTFVNDLFVGIGGTDQPEGSHRPVILTSSDGLTWTERWRGRQEPGFFPARDSFPPPVLLAKGATLLATVGSYSLLSTNNLNWVEAPRPWPELDKITVGANGFLAAANVFNAGNRDLQTWLSSDGLTWEKQVIKTNWQGNVRASAYGNGGYLLLTDGIALRSPDGRVWTEHSMEGTLFGYSGFSLHTISELIYASDTFVAVGQPQDGLLGQNSFARIFTSSDGTNWARRVGANLGSPSAASDGVGLVAITPDYAAPSARTLVLRSTNGSDWVEGPFLEGELLGSSAYGQNKYVAAGQSGVFTSLDGVSWTKQTNAGTGWTMLRYASGRFLGLGEENSLTNNFLKFGISNDGVTWTSHRVGASSLLDVATDGQSIVVVMGDSVMLRSEDDGATWSQTGAGAGTHLIAFGNGKYVALDRYVSGNGNSVLISNNGIKWTAHARFAQEDALSDLIFANGTFYAAVRGSYYTEFTFFTSSDGVRWTSHSSGLHAAYVTFTASTQGLFAFGAGSTILRSPWDIRLHAFERVSDSTTRFRVLDPAARLFEIQATASLSPPDWRAIPVTVDQANGTIVQDPNATNAPQRFYRAVSQQQF